MTNLPNNFQERDESWLENPDAVGYIYETMNMINGKMYIGKREKKKKDNSYFGSGKLLKYAMSKYGKKNFENRIIGWAYSKEDICKAERYFIYAYGSLSPKGYNLNRGGNGGSCKGRVFSPSHIEKMKQTLKKKFENMSQEEREKSFGGHKGRKLSDKTKKKISESLKKSWRSREIRDDKDEPSYS